MNELIPFEFESTPVRVVEVEGEPWFVLADLCKVLDVANVGNVAARLDDDMKGSIRLADGTPGNPNKTIVSEPGMYDVIVRSDSPQAKPFRRWVTAEVLPSIRKTGQYGTAPKLTGPALYLAAIEQATAEIAALETRNAELEPKAARFDDFLGAKGDYSFSQAAKVLQRDHSIDIGPRRLITQLTEWGWIYRHGRKKTVTAYQAQLETGRLSQRATTYMNQKTGEIVTGDPQTRVTPKGVGDIAARMTRVEVAS